MSYRKSYRPYTLYIFMRSALLYILFPTLCQCSLFGGSPSLFPQQRETASSSLFPQVLSSASFQPQDSWYEYFGLNDNYNVTTLPGYSYDPNKDVDISNKQSRFILYGGFCRWNGGAIACKNILISNNPYGFYAGENTSCELGGAIYATETCSITNNNDYWFIQNLAIGIVQNSSRTSNDGGAIQAKNCIISNNYGTSNFLNNIAATKGGAVHAEDALSVTKNRGVVTFKNNAVRGFFGEGGALYSAKSITISENEGPILFLDNQAGDGGACFANKITIEKNKGPISFSRNLSTAKNDGRGGALQAMTLTISDNMAPIIFENNQTQANGGACYFRNFTIKNNGPVTFLHNGSCWGGALLNDSSEPSQLTLFADYGDITFNQNYSISNTESTITRSHRNAMHCTKDLTVKFGASAGYSLKFYDPIEHDYPATGSVLFNPEPYHQGTILFSGATVDKNVTQENNFLSYLGNVIELKNGVLAVEDNGGIACYQLLQKGGITRLGQGGVITTRRKAGPESPDSSKIELNSIAINLPSVLKDGAQPPKIWIYPQKNGTAYTEDTGPTIKLSGPLVLLNEDNEDPYDSLDLSSPQKGVPLLYLLDNTTSKITRTDLNVAAINATTHYGHQGLWTPYWVETTTTTNSASALTANTKHSILYADWTSVGYIPNPARKGDLVANSLWQSAYTTLANLNTLSLAGADSIFSAAGHGLGLFVHQRGSQDLRGFRSHATGYAVHSSTTSATNHKVSLGFSQFFSRMKESQTHNTITSHDYFAGTKFDAPFFNESLETSLSLAYEHSSHRLVNKGASSGLFHSHTLGSSFSLALPPQNLTRTFQTTPFTTVQAVRSVCEKFSEEGSYARTFSIDKPLINVSMLLGVRSHWENFNHVPMLWELELAYLPTVYRQKPKLLTMLHVSKGEWETLAAPVSYNAFSAKIRNSAQIFNYMSISMNYSGEISSSTWNHYLQAGGQLQF